MSSAKPPAACRTGLGRGTPDDPSPSRRRNLSRLPRPASVLPFLHPKDQRGVALLSTQSSFCVRGGRLFAIGAILSAVLISTAVAQSQPSQTADKSAEPAAKPQVQSTQFGPDEPAAPAAVAKSPMRLSTGDLVDVNVYNVPDLATKARVGDNGDIYLPLVAYVHVAGLTPDEAQGIIEKRLLDGGFVKDPHVSLFVDSSASQGANILGSVVRPGNYPVVGDQRLIDLISTAGGFTTDAGRTATITRRSQPDSPVSITLPRNVSGSADANLPILPGDTVFVPKAQVIYVVGDVARPNGIFVDRDNLTVLQALALAGGPTHDAKLSGARVVRKGPTGTTETPLNLKKILEAKAPDMNLEPDDILFVPTRSGLLAATRSTAQIALQATTTVAYITVVR
jgi:polysaccharide biosynthesis/export protein